MYQQLALLRRICPRAAVGYGTFFAAAITLLPASGFAGGIELDSREYKLMLRPSEFIAADPQHAVKQFIKEQLVPAVRDQWNADAANELEKRGIEVGERRIVRFWDSGDCLLFRHGFAWRQRVDIDEHGTRAKDVEVTLKFRSPDAFLAAGTSLKAKQHARNDETKLEEDLGPVAVRSGLEKGVVANPRGARSQFSRSTKQTVPSNEVPTTLAGIASLYPSLAEALREAAGRIEMSSPFESSPEYRELVYESSKLDITESLKARFALTLWYEGAENQDRPALAEISFKYDTENGEVRNEVARRALALLLAMQDLPWADPSAPTKTALVACDRPS
jgi:hypothetical protein